MSAAAVLARETFTTSRLLEFTSRKELAAQTGTEPDAWPLMVVKELIDNALDACEEAVSAPVIHVTVARGRIRVRDNGPGIPASTVASILNFGTRTSSREAYVACDRGRQGNALKAVVAVPFALSGEEGRVEIMACGIRHEIAFTVDRIAQEPAIDHRQHPVSVRTGTSITVCWPESAWSELAAAGADFLPIIERFAALNPHLSICATWVDALRSAPTSVVGAGTQQSRRERWAREAADPGWTKWTPSAPTCPHWYRPADLERLAGAFLSHDRQRKTVRLLRDFVGQFNGLAGTAKRKEILAALGLQRAPLQGLLKGAEFDHDLVSRLLQAMQAAARPIKPEKLGPLGRAAVEKVLEACGGDPETFRYKLLKGVDDGVPWVAEAAFAYRPDEVERELICGLNWSPALDPTGDHFRLDYDLGANFCGPDEPIVVLAHLICPRPEFLDRGKTSLARHSPGFGAVRGAVEQVTKDWTKQRLAEIRDYSRERKRDERLKAQRAPQPISIKDVILAHLAEAIRETSGHGQYEFGERQLFYALRPIVQREAGKALVLGTFKAILTEYENQHGDIPGMYRKPRGYLYHPHVAEEIPLGTVNVRNYERPFWTFNKLVYCEKEGFLGNLRKIGWPERHDCALATTEGFTTRAIRDLIDMLSESPEPITVYCVHDADAYGTMIYQTLQEETKIRPRRKIEVVNLGLELWEAVELGLAVEDFPRGKHDRPVADYVKTRPDGQRWARHLQTERVELNEMRPAQFIAWITGKLEAVGIGKVIPPADFTEVVLREHARNLVKTRLTQELTKRAKIEARVAKIMRAIEWPDWPTKDAIRKTIERGLKREPEQRWSEPLYSLATKIATPLLRAIISNLDGPAS